ncbi:MAG: hypothetical protein M3454_02020 [Actinomycetota bacterium]|nr:hypothetical protein [Actinomycetota bacterium]
MSRQHGLITREQAILAGLSARQIDLRLRSGVWRRLLPRVYRPAELAATWHQRVMAACLWAGDGAAASHRTAAVLLRMPISGSGKIEISTPRRLERPGLVVHRRALRPNDVIRADGLSVTGVALTLLDLGAIESLERLEMAVDDVLVRGLITTDRLHAAVDGRLKGTAGAVPMRRVLEAYKHSPLESPLERRFLRLLRSAGLPEPEVQYPITDRTRLVARVDFAYPELRLAMEVDGYRWHGGRKAWAHDLSRRNELTNRRWRILHIAKEHMDGSGSQAVELVRKARSTKVELPFGGPATSGVGRSPQNAGAARSPRDH